MLTFAFTIVRPMKLPITIGLLIVLLAACNRNGEAEAERFLEKARQAHEQGLFLESKQWIDSVHLRCPKAYEARKAAQALELRAELGVQQLRTDSLEALLRASQAKLESIRHRYVWEKDTAYQSAGRYLWPSQTVERNVGRSFLRFQCNEAGRMSLTSIYCGAANIEHLAAEVRTLSGQSACTQSANSSYSTTVNAMVMEQADYPLEQDGGVVELLLQTSGGGVSLHLVGGKRPYSTSLRADDVQAAKAIYELSRVLTAIDRIKQAQEAAHLKMEFIRRKMERNAQATL